MPHGRRRRIKIARTNPQNVQHQPTRSKWQDDQGNNEIGEDWQDPSDGGGSGGRGGGS